MHMALDKGALAAKASEKKSFIAVATTEADDRLVWFSQNHGYIPHKRSQPGESGHFWSLRLVWF